MSPKKGKSKKQTKNKYLGKNRSAKGGDLKPRKIGRDILVLVIIFLLCWSIWPMPIQTQVLRINEDYITQIDGYECALVDQLLDYSFELRIPQKIWKSEMDYIQLDLQRDSDSGTASEFLKDINCNLTVEAKIQADNLFVETGSRIIATFNGIDAQTFLFNISASGAQPAEGQLWIAADVYDASGQIVKHLPLFIIPFQVEVVSILGLPPTIVRYACLFVLMILLAVGLRRRIIKQQ